MQRRPRLALGLGLGLLTALQGSAQPLPPLGFVSRHVWHVPDRNFGGFSAIELSDDGMGFVAISDRAVLIEGRFDRDATGRIFKITAGPLRPLLDSQTQRPLEGRRADSEGLAIGGGKAFLSFENRPRLAVLDVPSATVTDFAAPPAFAKLPRNAAVEAVAISQGPVLYTLPEDIDGASFPVFRWQDGVWDSAGYLPRRGPFLPVAADNGPDGRLYLLERDFHVFGGFSSRLRRFAISKSGLTDEAEIWTTPHGLHDNLEGLAVWQDAAGLRATLVSDDNFFALQRTEIVEYRLPD